MSQTQCNRLEIAIELVDLLAGEPSELDNADTVIDKPALDTLWNTATLAERSWCIPTLIIAKIQHKRNNRDDFSFPLCMFCLHFVSHSIVSHDANGHVFGWFRLVFKPI